MDSKMAMACTWRFNVSEVLIEIEITLIYSCQHCIVLLCHRVVLWSVYVQSCKIVFVCPMSIV